MPSAARVSTSNRRVLDEEVEENTSAEVIQEPSPTMLWGFVGLFFIAVAYLAYRQPLTIWDESRSLFNALELAASKHWIVPTYNGHPDHWYTKPPLFVWIVTVLIRVGLNPMVALRAPSLAAAFLSVCLIYSFAARALRRPVAGAAGALLLLSSTLFIAPHVALTGDLDALLTLLETSCALAFWLYVEGSPRRRTGWLIVSVCALVLAVLTKGIAGALFLPGMFAFLLSRRDRFQLLKDWKIWTGVLLAAGMVLFYYQYRESVDPGYIQAVFANELGRYSATVEGHKGGPLFYVVELAKSFEPGILAALLGCWFLLKKRASGDERWHSAGVFCVCVTFVFLLVLSGSKTKFGYYCVPALPLLSLLGGMGVTEALTALQRTRRTSPDTVYFPAYASTAALAALAVVACGLLALRAKHVEAHRRAADSLKWSGELDQLLRYDPGIKSVTIVSEPHAEATDGVLDYYPVARYWAMRYAVPRGIAVSYAGSEPEVGGHSWLIACDANVLSASAVEGRMERVVDASHGCIAGLTAK